MKYLFCWLALACALVCYAQRVREDRLWLTAPLALLCSLAVCVGFACVGLFLFLKMLGWFTEIGWLP